MLSRQLVWLTAFCLSLLPIRLSAQASYGGFGVVTPSTNGVLIFDGSRVTTTATGGGGTLCLTSTAGAAPVFGSCAGAAGTAWSSLANPAGNLVLSMAANTTAFTWNAATGSAALFSLADTASNTGSGYLLSVNTASGSTVKPALLAANGNGVFVSALGVLASIGTGSIMANTGTATFTQTNAGIVSHVLTNSAGSHGIAIGATSARTAIDFTDSIRFTCETYGNVGTFGGPTCFEIYSVTNAANDLSTTPAVTGSPPVLAAQGTDANVGLKFQTKGTGAFQFNTLTGVGVYSGGTLGTVTGTGSNCVHVDGTSAACGTGGSGSSAWDALTFPSTSLALSMGANSTTFTWNASTGAADMFRLTDTSGNTGTGILLHARTASGSTEIPFQADANGVGWQVDATGAWKAVGSSANGQICISGVTSGSACITVASIAGSPNPVALPTSTSVASGVLGSDGGNPQQMSWQATSGTGAVLRATSPVIVTPILGAATVSTLATATNCAVNSASPAACGSAASGAFVVPTSVATYTVNSTAVNTQSRIFLIAQTDASNLPSTPTCVAPALGNIVESARVAGTSFTFTLPSTVGTTCFSYWIVD